MLDKQQETTYDKNLKKADTFAMNQAKKGHKYDQIFDVVEKFKAIREDTSLLVDKSEESIMNMAQR